MKSYLLLFFSTLLLLFGTHKSSGLAGFAEYKQSFISKSCKYSTYPGFKKPCAKKYLKHQTHSESKDAANSVTDCTQQVYAIVTAQHLPVIYTLIIVQPAIVTNSIQNLTPFLETEHAPPRLS